jgi:hypothetical protein
MMRREIERLEVVPVVFDLRPLDALVAQSRKDGGDALERAGDRMETAASAITPRQGDVDPLGGESALEFGLFQRRLARSERLRQRSLDAVDFRATALALFRRQTAQCLERRGDDAVLAKQANAQGLERL